MYKIIVLFFIIIAVFTIFRYTLRYKIIPLFNIPEPASLDLKVHFTYTLLWITNYITFAAAYFYFINSIAKERQLRIAEERQHQAQKEKLLLENAQLRAQINPHFLFNTLGYFFNKVNDSHPEVAEGIISLTHIMRSTIRKTDNEGLVFLQEEVENIEHLISIYQMRYNNEVYIQFEQEGNLYSLRILPHILITLVENAFKHGDIHDAKSPLRITLIMDEEGLLFRVHNKKRFGPKELSHGIGVRYIQSQLESTYNAQHTFLVEDEEHYYTTSIFIDADALVQKQKATQALSL